MSCCGSRPSVNPEQPGVPGHWRSAGGRVVPGSAGCRVHTWRSMNALGIIGGPVVKVCTGCSETHWPTWVPDVVERPALTAHTTIVGAAEWLDVEPVREAGKRGAAA